MRHAVVMAGGSGTRFWPLSRNKLPKQFLKLFGDRSLLQQTVDRLAGVVPFDQVWVLTNQQQVEATREQLPEFSADQVIGEPCARDTAACIGAAAALIAAQDPDATMFVLAADHLIEPVAAFQNALQAAAQFVESHPEALVTFGIPPERPATGYGYLQRGEVVDVCRGANVFRLQAFHEKPSLSKAEAYLDDGGFYWNSGLFAWRAEAILQELERNAPELHTAVLKIAQAWPTPQRDRVFQEQFAALPKLSIDYAVMEKSKNVYMLEAPFGWDDVGSWLALERVLPADEDGNVVRGEHVGVRTSNSVVVADVGRTVATLGVSDLIIVATPDVTLVAHKNDEQAVKQLLAELDARGLGRLL